MLEILLLLLFNSLLIHGFHFSTQFDGWESYPDPGYEYGKDWRNILWWVRYYGEGLPVWIQEPLYGCKMCMSSIHGGYVFFLYLYINNFPAMAIWLFPVYALALCGTTMITSKFTI